MSLGSASRWAVSVIAIVLTLVAAWVAIDPPDPVSQRNADRIRQGMTQQQVIAIMGKAPDATTEDLREVWFHKSSPENLIVRFAGGVVQEVELDDGGEVKRSAWDRFLRWIGW